VRRIRTIKPELLDDGKTARLSHLEWRVFVSLFLLADDYGNFRAEVEQIDGAALWAFKEQSCREAISRLAELELLRFYEVNGQQYAHICGWEKHQKVDHPGKSNIPPPPRVSRDPRETLARIRENLSTDLDQEGKGEEGSGAAPGVVDAGDSERRLKALWLSWNSHQVPKNRENFKDVLKSYSEKPVDLDRLEQAVELRLNRISMDPDPESKKFLGALRNFIRDGKWETELIETATSPDTYVPWVPE
jgi:hypothetical protein